MGRVDWKWLNANMMTLSEDTLASMLDTELKVHKRPRFVVRLHQRLSTVRAARERQFLLQSLDA